MVINNMEMTLSQDIENTHSVAAIKHGCKAYPGVVALDNVNFSIARGEIRALLGKNGAGKSTLIRMLTGCEKLDSGQILIDGHSLSGNDAQLTRKAAALGVRAVYQELSLVEGLSVAENLFLGEWPLNKGVIDVESMIEQAQQSLTSLGVDNISPLQLVDTLSPAQKQLVEIARVIKGNPKIVILDEPTSSLATAEVELVASAVLRMSQAGIAVIYVSHRMNEIRRLASSATVMRDGKVAGNVKLESTTTRQIVELMLGHQEHKQDSVVPVASHSLKEIVLAVKSLDIPPKLHNITFDLYKGEVLGIAGLLGSGRTELLKAISGLSYFSCGEILWNGKKITKPRYKTMLEYGLGYTPENRKDEGIMPLLGVDENTIITNRHRISRFGILQWPAIKQATLDIIKRMHIKTSDGSTPISTLSGGNQQKVVIGRWVFADSTVLFLDEPTRGVDVEAKSQIYQIIRRLAAEGKSIIFISSEVEELPQVCDRIILLRQGTIEKTLNAPVNVDELMAELLAAH